MPTRVRYQALVTGRVEVLEPGVGPQLGRGRPVVGVDLHASHDNVARAERNMLWNL